MSNLETVDFPPLTPAGQQAASLGPLGVLKRWARGMAPGTRRNSFRSARCFASFAVASGQVADLLRQMAEQGPAWCHNLVADWKRELLGKGLSVGTVNGYLHGVASLTRVARQTGLIAWRLERVSLPPEPREDLSGPPWMAVQALLDHLDGDPTPVGCRDSARA